MYYIFMSSFRTFLRIGTGNYRLERMSVTCYIEITLNKTFNIDQWKYVAKQR